jgi:dTDP-4-amino-4,6-dideoxygalactose transaminase
MIPRRRLPLAWADFATAVSAIWLDAATADAEVAAFETEFAAFLGVPHALATASGRDALCLIVDALGLAAGDEIVVPAYTLGELLPLLAERGLQAVPADIEPETFNLSIAAVQSRLGPATRAILVLHEFGAPCDVPAIVAMAAARGIAVIEDCAHAPGASIAGRPVGSFGDAALFSLESNKALAAFGGGVAATRRPDLAARIRAALAGRQRRNGPALRKYLFKLVEELGVRSPLYALVARILFAPGRAAAFESFYRRANQRIRVPDAFSGLQARWARRRLAELPARNARLEALAEGFAAGLPPGFCAQQRRRVGTPAFYHVVARYSGDIAALRQAALREGLDLGIGPEVMDDCARLLGHADCPGAARAFAEAVLIPCWDGMNEATARRALARLARAAAAQP